MKHGVKLLTLKLLVLSLCVLCGTECIETYCYFFIYLFLWVKNVDEQFRQLPVS